MPKPMKERKLKGKRRAKVAAKAAPAEVPMIYGSAKGLRSKPWNRTPAIARAPPTKAAPTALGRRISKKMVSSVSRQVGGKWNRVILLRLIFSRAKGEMEAAPNREAKIKEKRKTPIKRVNIIHGLFLHNLILLDI
jgi:hypothetical protein